VVFKIFKPKSEKERIPGVLKLSKTQILAIKKFLDKFFEDTETAKESIKHLQGDLKKLRELFGIA